MNVTSSKSDMQNNVEIIADKDSYIVINKPAGIVVNKVETQHALTIQDWIENGLNKSILQKLKDSADPIVQEFVSRGGVVHRLDKETSGLLILAKNPDSFAYLKNQFKQGLVEKTYSALAHGNVVPREGEISIPIGRLPWNRVRFGVLADGREATTFYKVVQYYELLAEKKKYPLTFLEAYPKTGRTHQIRVHMQHLGFPLFGDELYAGRKQSRVDRRILSRHFLHASRLSFIPPGESEKVVYASELPEDLQNVLGMIRLLE